MSTNSQFRMSEWIVPPIAVPVLLGLLIVLAVLLRS
jgi:hypothetical protein